MIDVHSRLHKKQKGSSASPGFAGLRLIADLAMGHAHSVLVEGTHTMANKAYSALKFAISWSHAAGSSANSNTADDLVEQVAADMIKEAWLLCFDEFQVTHISFLAQA
eukprot:Skav212230  [mRNA]  locus=scaffold4279:80787:81507:+ [translate_table: standard]